MMWMEAIMMAKLLAMSMSSTRRMERRWQMDKTRLVLVLRLLCDWGNTQSDMKMGQRVKRAGRGEVRRMETISTGEVSLLVREQGGFLD